MLLFLVLSLIGPASAYLSIIHPLAEVRGFSPFSFGSGNLLSDLFFSRALPSMLQPALSAPRYELHAPPARRYETVAPPLPPRSHARWAEEGDLFEWSLRVPPQAHLHVEEHGGHLILKAVGDGRWGRRGLQYAHTVPLPCAVQDSRLIRAERSHDGATLMLLVPKPMPPPARSPPAKIAIESPPVSMKSAAPPSKAAPVPTSTPVVAPAMATSPTAPATAAKFAHPAPTTIKPLAPDTPHSTPSASFAGTASAAPTAAFPTSPRAPKWSDQTASRMSQEEMFKAKFGFLGMEASEARSEDWTQGPFWATKREPGLWEEDDEV